MKLCTQSLPAGVHCSSFASIFEPLSEVAIYILDSTWKHLPLNGQAKQNVKEKGGGEAFKRHLSTSCSCEF